MAKRRVVKKPAAVTETNDGAEPMLITLAEQLGSFLGRLQGKADVLMESESVQHQVGLIRDGATQLLERVNQASESVRKSAAKVATSVKSSVAPAGKSAPPAPPAPKRSRGAVDAPGKKHRKPPPQEKIARHMGEPVGKQMGQKSMKNRMRSGRG
jgi:hypothetical protein